MIGRARLGEIWGRIGVSPRGGVTLLVIFVVLLVGSKLVELGLEVSGIGACTSAERRAYEEFPQYGNVEIRPETRDPSACYARFYDARTPRDRISEYYVGRLEAHGWKVEAVRRGEWSARNNENFDALTIHADRDGYFYYTNITEQPNVDARQYDFDVASSSQEPRSSPPTTTKVEVYVFWG